MPYNPLSNIVFPNFVTGIKDVNSLWFKGGYDYQGINPVNNRYTKVTIVKDILSFNVADHMVEPTSPYVIETETVKVFTFPNNYYFGVRVKMKPSGAFNTVEIYGDLYDKTDVKVPNNEIQNFGQFSYGQNISADLSILGLTVDIILTTKYYPTADPPAGTYALSLAFEYIAGFRDSDYNLPQGITYLNGISGLLQGIPTNVLFRWDDLAPFNTYMKSHGDPFDGDVFDTDPIPDDPAGTDDPSQPGGGTGNYDNTSDEIDFPDLPHGGALVSGAVKAHVVSAQTLQQLFSKLWSNSILDIPNMWQKSLQDPMEAIVSLHALPVGPEVDGSTDIEIGNFNSELTSPEITSQYKIIDCGTLNINEYWGSALDYSPYTRTEIFLPFIGVKDIAVEDVMRSTIHIKYHVDVLTGECIAFIKCGLSVLYRFKGNCKMNIPLSSASMDLIQNTLGALGHTITPAMGVAVGGGAGALAGTVISSAVNIASTKIRTNKSGDMSGSSSLMDDFRPYLIIHRPIQSLAKSYNNFKGYPSNITARLGTLSGYTEIDHIHLKGLNKATDTELAEIESLLKEGVII